MRSVREPEVILPITTIEVEEALNSEPGHWFENAGRAQVCCLHILGMIPRLTKSPEKAPNIVQTALNDVLRQLDTPGAITQFRSLAAKSFRPGAVRDGLDRLSELGIGLRAASEWDATSPLNADGTLNSDFSKEIIDRRAGRTVFHSDPMLRSLGLTASQTKIATKILGQPEEPISIQGYSGTGKTRLVHAIVSCLPREHTVIIARTKAQLDALLESSDLEGMPALLFGDFARRQLLVAGVSRSLLSSVTTQSSYNVTDQTIADQMQFGPIENLSPQNVAKAMRGALFLFCESDADRVSTEHIPKAYSWLPSEGKFRLVRYTQEYWDQMITTEASEAWQPMRHFVLIKWASLLPGSKLSRQNESKDTEEGITGRNGVLVKDLRFAVVDEAHDLTPALAKVLANSDVAVYSLGDTFQRIQGVPPKVDETVLKSTMEESMRAGSAIDSLINPILNIHPRFQEMESFRGIADTKTKVHFYDVRKIPDSPYTILCGTHFHIFEYLHQLIAEGAKTALLPGSLFSFHSFVEGLLDLWRGRRPRGGELFRFRNWEELRTTFGKMQVFPKIERTFEKGYSEASHRNMAAQLSNLGEAKYIVGRAEDSKNWQFPNVMISPELLSFGKRAEYVPKTLSTVYLAISRAQRSVAVPRQFYDWVESQENVLKR